MNIPSSIENKIYFNKYKTDSKIGQGSFGKIYSAHNINNGELYALKLEKRNGGRSLLETETYILCYLKGEGIPFIKSYGFSGEYNILVMELLGKSLETLFQENNCKFSLKTVCMLAEQMITRLEYIHKKYILHRDIKPDNFTIGRGKQSHIIYLIDFGLSKKYRSSKGNHEHIKYSENKRLIGTARYASINALKGCEQGRRDDMEALGYVLMYFLRGNLPWQGLKLNRGDDRYKKIYETKKKTTAEELCIGYPKQFCEYIKYTRNLSFEQEPDYNYLKKLIFTVMDKYEINLDFLYDWGLNRKKNQNKEHMNIINNYSDNLKKENNYLNNKNNCDDNDGSNNAVENKNLKIVTTKKQSEIKKKGYFKNNNNKKNNNNDSKLNHTFFPKNNFNKKKNFNKKNYSNNKTTNKLINSLKNKNNLIKSTEKIKDKKLFNKNLYELNFLDTLLINESYMSDGVYTNVSQNINSNRLHYNHYKFLSELNSSSKKKYKDNEYRTKKNKEITTNISINYDKKEIKDNNCTIF